MKIKEVFKLNNCNGSKKKKLVIAAANYARKVANLNEPIWVFINKGKVFKSKIHSGLYDKDSFSIRFNRDWLITAKDERIVKCAIHEVFHAVQHVELIKKELGMTSELFTEEELIQLELDFKDENYDDSVGVYENLLAEIQAEEFAELVYSKYLKELKTTKVFIEENYSLFVNEE